MTGEPLVERIDAVTRDVALTCDDCGRGTPATLVVGCTWVCDACADGMASEIRRLIRAEREEL